MKISLNFKNLAVLVAAAALAPCFAAPSLAQQGGGGGQGGGRGPGGPPAAGRGPQITDPKEAAAYQAFVVAKGDKKIQAGDQFVATYPKSIAASGVAEQVVSLNFQKQDWPAFYAASDKALAIKPDDTGILAITSFVIARNFKDGQTSPTLDQAETDAKAVLAALPTLPKPATITDDQFNQQKLLMANQAHDSLGMVYSHEQKPQDAIDQLQQIAQPDAIDDYMIGVADEMLGKHADASTQFQKCSAVPGALQAPCTQAAADTAKEK
jgi:hypothetical protein